MRLLSTRLAMLATAALLSHAAAAQTYAIASAGASAWDGDAIDGVCDANDDCDRVDTASRLVLGYEYTPGLAVELGFWDFGRFIASTGSSRATATATSAGLGVAVLGRIQPSLMGAVRVGLASVRGQADDNVGAGFSEAQTTAQVYAGFSLGYAASRQLSVEGSWDLSQVRVDAARLKDTVHAITLGVRLGF